MPRQEPYKDIDPDDLITRDWLALGRSRLANERTLLAYARTAVAMVGLGLILAKWFDHLLAIAAGGLLIVLGIVVAMVGLLRFLQENRRYRPLTRSGK